ncbi:MAG: ATP-binding protein [Bacteroidia bacterium]|nr:ATP-binding protein [Bacteroidia bacterium]MDW8157794.1 ATP-binding protein [Bacteroidia bacterium]
MNYTQEPKKPAEDIDLLSSTSSQSEFIAFEGNSKHKIQKLEIFSEEEIVKVEAFIDDLYEEYKIREDVYGHIMTTVTEAVNNGLIHGNKLDPTKKVTITSRLISSYLLSFTVQDEGDGFDFEAVIQKDIETVLENYHKTGRGIGIFLMRSLTDSFQFIGKGNIVELVFHI